MISKPLITAHSGCENTKRDSIESVFLGIDAHADAIEVDVRLDLRGRLVLSHDKKRQQDYDNGATLEQAMQKISKYDKLSINCDLKEDNLASLVIDMAQKYGIGSNRLILSGSVTPEYLSSHPETAEKASVYLNAEHILTPIYLSSLDPKDRESALVNMKQNVWQTLGQYSKNIEPYITLLSAAVRSTGAKALNIPYLLITESRMERFKKEGIKISVWTVNETADMENMISWGVSNITTLNVGKALKILDALSNT